jgi:hypothetical protein
MEQILNQDKSILSYVGLYIVLAFLYAAYGIVLVVKKFLGNKKPRPKAGHVL